MGLSMVTKLALRRMTAVMMGVWFLATAIGNKLAGRLGYLWDLWPYHKFFGLLRPRPRPSVLEMVRG